MLIEEEVEVTHIQSPSSFFVQRKADTGRIENLSRKINAFAKTSISQEVVPLVGEFFVIFNKLFFLLKIETIIL